MQIYQEALTSGTPPPHPGSGHRSQAGEKLPGSVHTSQNMPQQKLQTGEPRDLKRAAENYRWMGKFGIRDDIQRGLNELCGRQNQRAKSLQKHQECRRSCAVMHLWNRWVLFETKIYKHLKWSSRVCCSLEHWFVLSSCWSDDRPQALNLTLNEFCAAANRSCGTSRKAGVKSLSHTKNGICAWRLC